MKKSTTKFMASEDERQYMLNEDFEVFEKRGTPIGATKLHYHNFYEIIYVMEGEFSSLVENVTYNLKKGDFLLIDRNAMHKYHYVEHKHERSKRIILWISNEMLNQLSNSVLDLSQCFSRHCACAYHFPIYYEEMLRNMLIKLALTDAPFMEHINGKELMDRAHLTMFFVYLNELCSRKDYYFRQEEMVLHPLVKTVSEYIGKHIQEPISVDDLASYVNMSKYHFLRKFKELTGMTVHSFIINKKLIVACEEIKKDCPITEVYLKAGFADYSSFFRNFKNAYGISPSGFKTSHIESDLKFDD